MNTLELDGIDVHYGDFQAIFGLSLAVEAGRTLAVVGANGAGKSTLLKAISGQLRNTAGRILLNGRDISAMPTYRRVVAGVSLTPEGRRIFPSLSVEENLRLGAFSRRTGPWRLESVYEAIPLLAEIREKPGAVLSGGEQQATAIGRSLMSNPELLLLDEVSLGLAPVVVGQIYDMLPSITASGTTVLIVEQDIRHALRASETVHCLLEGRTVLSGASDAISREQLAEAYFGV